MVIVSTYSGCVVSQYDTVSSMVSSTKVTCVPNCCCLPPPSAQRIFAEHKADIALVPAAAVPSLADADIVTEYCIGAAGPVRTVVLLSGGPIETVRRVFLDAHSLTSVQLAGYLLAKHWKVSPEYYTLEDYAQLDRALPGDAFLLIGDKVFDYEGRFAYSYDLAAEWKKGHASALRLRRLDRPQGCRSRSDRRVAACADFRHRTHVRGRPRTRLRPQTVRCVRLPNAEYRLYFRQSEA